MDSARDPRDLRFPKPEEPDDRLPALMGEIRDGSGSALQELMDRLWEELVRYAAWEVGEIDVAKDLVQGAFVYLWEHRRSWINVGSPRAYLYRIVQHRVIDYQRHRSVRTEWARREESRPRRGPPTPADVLAEKEVQEAFDQAMAGLPPRRREAFYLVALRGLSHREASEVLGISLQTVANQVSAALQAIRTAIRRVSDSAS